MTDHLTSPNFGGLSDFAIEPTKVEKPWGYELIWALTDDYCGKILFVKAGESLSLQFHREKDESWFLQTGRAELEMGAPGDKTPELGDRRAREPPSGSGRGRSTASRRSRTPMILEVSTPQLEDVVRLEDSYGRVETLTHLW